MIGQNQKSRKYKQKTEFGNDLVVVLSIDALNFRYRRPLRESVARLKATTNLGCRLHVREVVLEYVECKTRKQIVATD